MVDCDIFAVVGLEGSCLGKQINFLQTLIVVLENRNLISGEVD